MLSSQEIASMTATANASLDISMPFSRKTTGQDGYGHSTETWASQGSKMVNTYKPTATILQTYASIIGTQKALMIRFATTTDIKEGDRATYLSRNWLVQYILDVESFTFVLDAIITEVQ